VSACLSAGDDVLDIGANVGLWSVQLGRRLAALGGRVWAFEPVATNFARLERNVLLNGLGRTKVTTIRTALGDEEGR
jgi:FkbM family methyltransferase